MKAFLTAIAIVLLACAMINVDAKDTPVPNSGKPIIREQGHTQPPRVPTPPVHPQRKPIIR